MEVTILVDTPTSIAPTAAPYVAPTQQVNNPPVSGGARWIDINLSTQQLFAYEGDTLVNSFIVSTGVSATPTVTGTFKVYARYLYADMRGPGYFLPDVPYTMYFHKSYGIHGTYWHNNFGTPMSHGCVNMSIADAGWVYNWSTFGTTVTVHY
ncbi:MAG: L,D-transpeptidase [Chloroflexi bacterium]|nr:L,D-transpeptidase [Chloroflexota bacterium]